MLFATGTQLTSAIPTQYAIHNSNMPVLESNVLKPKDPSLAEEDWAEFVLSDASAVHESNGKHTSLLAAYADTPLRVQGRLETPAREHAHHRTPGAHNCRASILL